LRALDHRGRWLFTRRIHHDSDWRGLKKATAIRFQESPAGSALDWHTAPHAQYVITLSGTLEFTTRDGETFVLRPGEVLLAADTTGTGHRWRLIDDQPWRRLYVELRLPT
jgi:quercetin dioxygenase-like cupin family protein